MKVLQQFGAFFFFQGSLPPLAKLAPLVLAGSLSCPRGYAGLCHPPVAERIARILAGIPRVLRFLFSETHS